MRKGFRKLSLLWAIIFCTLIAPLIEITCRGLKPGVSGKLLSIFTNPKNIDHALCATNLKPSFQCMIVWVSLFPEIRCWDEFISEETALIAQISRKRQPAQQKENTNAWGDYIIQPFSAWPSAPINADFSLLLAPQTRIKGPLQKSVSERSIKGSSPKTYPRPRPPSLNTYLYHHYQHKATSVFNSIIYIPLEKKNGVCFKAKAISSFSWYVFSPL